MYRKSSYYLAYRGHTPKNKWFTKTSSLPLLLLLPILLSPEIILIFMVIWKITYGTAVAHPKGLFYLCHGKALNPDYTNLRLSRRKKHLISMVERNL